MNDIDKALFPKKLVLAAGILSQICLGSVYAWSAIGSRLNSDYGLSTSSTELIYGLSIGVFALGTMLTGRLVYRWGPALLTKLSGLLFLIGYTGASFSGGNVFLLLFFLGFVNGSATAFGYVCPLSTAVAWYPRHKGLVTGLAVMGFGGGAIVSAQVIHLMSLQGFDILEILRYIGLSGGVILFVASFLLRFPAAKAKQSPGQIPSILSHQKPFHHSKVFWTLCVSMFLSSSGGLIVIGSLLNVASEMGYAAWGPLALSLIAIGNAGGRIVWGMLMDKIGSKALIVSNVIMSLGFLLLIASGSSLVVFLLATLITGLQFGATLVIYATFSEKYYGAGAIGRVYPFVFACYGLAAIVGPGLGGLLHDATRSYSSLLVILVLLPVLSIGMLQWGLKPIKRR